MSVRIVHISDIHHDHRSHATIHQLENAIKKARPDIIVCTGDLVFHPWPRNVQAAKAWLQKLLEDCNLTDGKLLIVPGNHDFGFWGLLGWSALTGHSFRAAFKAKWEPGIQEFPEENLVFVRMNSTPKLLRAARGRVSSRQLKKLSEALGESKMRSPTRIALLHHHCLPVYNDWDDPDSLLLLKNVQEVIKFFASQNIDLVLHGHTHQSTYSLLSVGGIDVENRSFEALAAGTASQSKADAHNFNLITIDKSRFRHVTQFFSKPEGSPFVPGRKSYGFARALFSQLHHRSLQLQPFAARRIHWDLQIKPEGDRYNEMRYRGFHASPFALLPQKEYFPPAFSVDAGKMSGATLADSKDLRLEEIARSDRSLEFKIVFRQPPTKEKPADFTIQSWDLNTSSMDREEFAVKHPDRKPPFREWEEKTIDTPVENFSWQITFPDGFVPKDVRFEVWDVDAQHEQEEMSEMLQPEIVYSTVSNSAFLNLCRPPAGYRYRISWDIPQGRAPWRQHHAESARIASPVQSECEHFTNSLLTMNLQTNFGKPPELSLRARAVLEAYKLYVRNWIAEKDKNCHPEEIELDVDLMVYDKESERLSTAVSTIDYEPRILKFLLEPGDGNAGRAFKRNLVRIWFNGTSLNQTPFQTYVPLSGTSRRHEFLCSIPLHHPGFDRVIIGILNIGAFTTSASRPCRRCLKRPEHVQWLIETAHHYVLNRLLEITQTSSQPHAPVVENVKQEKRDIDAMVFSFQVNSKPPSGQMQRIYPLSDAWIRVSSQTSTTIIEDRVFENLLRGWPADWRERPSGRKTLALPA
jgi:predicted phosphodiesterase